MEITLNGEPYDLPDSRATVVQLIERLGLADAPVAVEVNQTVIPKARHREHRLGDGDVVEVVTLVGGG